MKLRFYGLLIVFGSFAHKVAQTWFVLQQTIYVIVLTLLKLKIIVICFKLRAKLSFYGFLRFFNTCAHKVAQALFVLQETWHATLFGMYYCVEVVRI